jgi:hypothetical protein
MDVLMEDLCPAEKVTHAIYVNTSKHFYSFMYLLPLPPKEIVVLDLSTKVSD